MPDNTLLVGLISAGSVLAGVVISTGVQLFLSREAHKQQLERDRKAYELSVQDEKRARTQEKFATIRQAAFSYIKTADYLGTELAEEYASEMRKSDDKIEEILTVLAIEGGNDEIVSAFKNLIKAFTEYIDSFSNEEQRNMTKLLHSFYELQAVMQKRYVELEKAT